MSLSQPQNWHEDSKIVIDIYDWQNAGNFQIYVSVSWTPWYFQQIFHKRFLFACRICLQMNGCMQTLYVRAVSFSSLCQRMELWLFHWHKPLWKGLRMGWTLHGRNWGWANFGEEMVNATRFSMLINYLPQATLMDPFMDRYLKINQWITLPYCEFPSHNSQIANQLTFSNFQIIITVLQIKFSKTFTLYCHRFADDPNSLI